LPSNNKNYVGANMTLPLVGNATVAYQPFFFVRHGQTDWSKEDITNGPGDYSLNELGIQEANSAAETIASMNEKCVVFSSTLLRAKETAQVIANKINTSINLFPDLHERYFGDFRLLAREGCTPCAIPPDAESESSFKERISVAVSSVLNADAFYGKKKIIVSHGLVFKQLSLSLTGKEMAIGYGEIILFTPAKNVRNWTAQEIVKLN
jgi:uncharacterized phosphatase